jgi:hypothetical protein
MPDFQTAKDQLKQARDAHAQARQALYKMQQKAQFLDAQGSNLLRTLDAKQRKAGINKQQAASADRKEKLAELKAAVDHAAATERGAIDTFLPHLDPKEASKQLDDQIPLLLFPVRMETRFKTLGEGAEAKSQLWVRVYPDDCLVDTFEPTLSDGEIQDGQTYWRAVWKAGGITDQERGAWRSLVASHGSGRAAWILQQYRPTNLNDKPAKDNADDVILVIPTDTQLPREQATVAQIYWQAVWLADGNQDSVDDAWKALTKAVQKDPAETIRQDYQPVNLQDRPQPPKKKSDVAAKVAFLVFPKPADVESKRRSWTQSARVNLLPDCFTLIGYAGGKKVLEQTGNPIPSPLIAGPDPSAPADQQLQQKNGELFVGNDMKWMVDFDRAVQVGMGFRVDLTPAQARQGFERLIVLGIRFSLDQEEGRQQMEALLQHHQYGTTGFSLLPQGTPTNNTEQSNSGLSRHEDADDSFSDYFSSASLFQNSSDWMKKKDGQWLAECLGIDSGILKKVKNSGGTDQSEARAMNVALWPATLGYMMTTMMYPLIPSEAVESVHWLLSYFVSGRGMVPAIRIGKQPYGILPTSVLSRLAWPSNEKVGRLAGVNDQDGAQRKRLSEIYEILRKMDGDWSTLAGSAAYVGKTGDPHQLLLDIIGLHPTSVEYYQRTSESVDDLFNRWNLEGRGPDFLSTLAVLRYTEGGMALLRKLGALDQQAPDVLNHLFLDSANLLKGPLVDDRALSETVHIRAYTDDQRNYVQWLADAAKTSLDTLRLETGFSADKPPTTLLYLMLRHALLQSYWRTSLQLHLDKNLILPEEAATLQREASFIHVQESAAGESRWTHLYKKEQRITGDPQQLVGEYISTALGHEPATLPLGGIIDALELLDVPTARLERCFAEHIDCCSYRLDAWQQGLIHYQLALMRYRQEHDQIVARKGIFLGAYGWLEHVRSKRSDLAVSNLEQDLAMTFQPAGSSPLMRDPTNGGYIHAPSLPHAVTAAVLRGGYLANATPTNPQTLSVNLSSSRVRIALSFLEGMRQGQSLGALLGYQFERGLHDSHNLAEVDEFIYKLRKQFPLLSGQIEDTQTPADVPIEAIEARNVVDGLALVNYVRKTGTAAYPFGLNLPSATTQQALAIDAEVNNLLDVHDAIADLGIAESVYQAVQSNYERVGANLDTYGKGQFPPEPGVAQTPRSGRTLTHRVGLHLEAGLNEDISPVPWIPVTPRGRAEPAVNKWLSLVLPSPANIACKVNFFNFSTGAMDERNITQQDLQLQPIDLLYIASLENQQAMNELDNRILLYVWRNFLPRPDSAITIYYTSPIPGKVSFFELAPLVRCLRGLILRSRSLQAADPALQGEATSSQTKISVNPDRLKKVRDDLQTLQSDFGQYRNDLKALHSNEAAHRQEILDQIDDHLEEFIDLLERASRFGVAQGNWGFVLDWKRQAFAELVTRVSTVVTRWTKKLSDYADLITQFNALPNTATDKEKFALLGKAERLVARLSTATPPAPPADYLVAVNGKRDHFAARLDDFRNLQSTSTDSLATLLQDFKDVIAGPPPVSSFDLEGIDLGDSETTIIAFSAELMARADNLSTNLLNTRLTPANAKFTAADALAESSARAKLLGEVAKLLLGEEFQIVPEFSLTPDQAAEIQNALDASKSGELFKFQTDTQKQPFPTDTWLYGVARVREKMRQWEQCVMLSEILSGATLQLEPIQLPYQADDSWLALEYPADYAVGGDRLLYTAQYPAGFDPAQPQCGLLLDEWTEVIPGESETTGITFHFDRPNSEPPQTMLLVTPPDFTGAWQWQDVVDAVTETLDRATKRSVEPTQIDGTNYAPFLPATMMASTLYQISITANLARNNKDYNRLVEASRR